MRTELYLVSVLTYIVSTCLAANFSVLCNPYELGGTGVSVNIDGTSYSMSSKNNDILFEYSFNGTPTKYYYEITNTTNTELKTFGTERQWNSKEKSTLYEVYGRRHTVGDDIIKTIPRLYAPLQGYKDFSLLFQEGEIPVINIHINERDYTELINMTEEKEFLYYINFDLYTPHSKFTYHNATLKLSGQGSTSQEKKPYKIDLSKDETDKKNTKILGLKEFKLRSIRYDETGIKNKIVNDISESLGLPYAQTAPCRLYMNNKSYGLYEISDLYKKRFLRRFFNIEKKNNEYVYGAMYKGHYKGGVQAYLYPDLQGKPINSLYESIVPETGVTDIHAEINNVISWLNALPDNASKDEIEKQFDTDMFLKYALIEYLICHWDGYLGHGNNYFIYIEPNNGKYHFFSYDFDLTLGKWCHAIQGKIDEYVENVNDEDEKPLNKPLLYTKIINNPEIRPIFDELTKEVVTNLFNIEGLGPRIDYFYEFLKDDLSWDVSCYNIIETKLFSGDANAQPIPTVEGIHEIYTNTEKEKTLKGYIKAKSENVLAAYNVTAQFKAEGKYGTVGDKLIEEEKNTVSNLGVTSDSTSNKPAILLLMSLLTILLVNLMKL